MTKRFDTGTDVAMIGAWDVTRTEPIRKSNRVPVLDADADDGLLLLINTGSDGGYLVEVRLDELVPDSKRFAAAGRERLLRVPGGRLKVGGVEDYRSDRPPQITSELDEMGVPPGDYSVQLYLEREPDLERSGTEAVTDDELLEFVSADDLRFTNRQQRAGCTLMLLCLAAAVVVGWHFGLSAGAVVGFASLLGISRLFKRFGTDARVMRVQDARRTLTLRKSATLPADFTLVLRPLAVGEVLAGGAIQLEEEEAAIRAT